MRKVNWVDVTISGAGLVGEAAKFCGIEGIVVYGLTEIAEVGGGINDLYTFASAAENGKTFSTIYTLGKMGIDLGELAPNYGLIFNLADLGLAIAPALSFEEEIICLNCQ